MKLFRSFSAPAGARWLAALLLGSACQLASASSEANLVLPNLNDPALAVFLGGMTGWQLLSYGLLVCIAGLAFGAVVYGQIKAMPVHRSMAEVSEIIYETCKTYMITQGKFILVLEVFIGAIIVAYFGWVQHMHGSEVVLILAFSLVSPPPGSAQPPEPTSTQTIPSKAQSSEPSAAPSCPR